MSNIIKDHISRTEKKLKKYCNIILKNKYDAQITTELIKTYIDARYYDYFENRNSKVFYKSIQNAIENRGSELKEKYAEKIEKIDFTVSLFPYFFYFDYVRNNVSIQEIIEEIDKKRKSTFGIKSTDDFILEFTEMVIADFKEVDDEIEKYNTKDFELKIKRINPKDNRLFKVNLDYNLKFPMIFSKEAIDITFNTDIIAEDKLFVEYPMIASVALTDILQGNFSKMYLVEFSASLLKKKKKLEQILQTIDNPCAQDKICFEIGYDDFVASKVEIFSLIKRGFKFALLTDSTMEELSQEKLKILEIFEFILVGENDINKNLYNKSKIIEI